MHPIRKAINAILVACVGVALATISVTASAVEVSFKFTGSLTSVTDNFGFLSGEFAAGNSFEGVVTYDTNGTEGSTTINDPTTGIYRAVKRLRTSINGYEFDGVATSLLGSVQVWDDRVVGPNVVDSISFTSPLDYTPPIGGMGPGTVVGGVFLYLFDSSHTASQFGKAIPNSFSFADYGSTSFSALQLNVDTNQAFHLNGRLTSMELVTEATPAPIPEPSSYALMIVGLGFVLGTVRRRKQKAENRKGERLLPGVV